MKSFAVVDNRQELAMGATLKELFQRRVALTQNKVAYRQYDAVVGKWCEYTWRQMASSVSRWRAALAEEDLSVGDLVAVLVTNSVEWVCFEQAALTEGLVVVPLFTADTLHNQAYMLGDTDAVLLLVANMQTRKIQRAVLENLTTRLRSFPRHAQNHGVYLTLQPWTVEAGLVAPTSKPKRTAIEAKFAAEIDGLYYHRHTDEHEANEQASEGKRD